MEVVEMVSKLVVAEATAEDEAGWRGVREPELKEWAATLRGGSVRGRAGSAGVTERYCGGVSSAGGGARCASIDGSEGNTGVGPIRLPRMVASRHFYVLLI